MLDRFQRRPRGGAAEGRTWAALVLLFLVVLIPAATVSWLVLKASEDKQLVMEKVYEDARTGFLETGRGLIRAEIAGRGERLGELVAGVPAGERWSRVRASREADGYVPPDQTNQSGRMEAADSGAEPSADSILNELEEIGSLRRRGAGEELAERVDALLNRPELAEARMADGRRIAPMVAFLATETATGDDERAEARARLSDLFLNEEMRSTMPPSQMLFYLGRIRDWNDDPEIKALHRFVRNSVEWVERSRAQSEVERSLPVSRSGPLIGLRPTPSSGVLIFEEGTLVSLIRERLDSLKDRAGGRLVLRESLPSSTAVVPGGEVDSTSIQVEAGFPLNGWVIEFQEDEGMTAMGRANREVIWLAFVGAFVIALSIVLSLALFGVMQRQTRLAQLKNDLVATVSHELKTPVASIRLLVDTLQSGPDPDPARVRDYLGLIARENKRLGHLIENFLSFSRMERDKDSFDRRPIHPEEIVREAEAVFRERQSASDGTFRIETATGLPMIRADREALQTALGNLLENAQKYGGKNPDVTLTVGSASGWVEFSVTDHGIGIARDEQKRILE